MQQQEHRNLYQDKHDRWYFKTPVKYVHCHWLQQNYTCRISPGKKHASFESLLVSNGRDFYFIHNWAKFHKQKQALQTAFPKLPVYVAVDL